MKSGTGGGWAWTIRLPGGIDYLVGDPAARGRGLGTAITAFVEDTVFGRHPGWNQVCASPVAANTASLRALQKAGFDGVGTFEYHHGTAVLMALRQ